MRWGTCFAILVLASACASSIEPAPTYEPLVCDPAAADHVAFAVQESSGWFGPEARKAYGTHFLLIDGSCRYYTASRADTRYGRVRTGSLTAEQLDAINAELLAGPWATIDGEHHGAWGTDLSTLSLWRDDFGASCYFGCAPSETLSVMFEIAIGWEERLGETGVVLDGDVRLFLQRSSPPIDGPAAVEWTGTEVLSDAVPGYYGSVVVTDPTDVTTLRALRDALTRPESGVLLREGDAYFRAIVVDVMPHVNEDGRFLPPFPIDA